MKTKIYLEKKLVDMISDQVIKKKLDDDTGRYTIYVPISPRYDNIVLCSDSYGSWACALNNISSHLFFIYKKRIDRNKEIISFAINDNMNAFMMVSDHDIYISDYGDGKEISITTVRRKDVEYDCIFDEMDIVEDTNSETE